MGRYIAVTADYNDRRADAEVFRAALGSSAFSPRGLAAIEIKESSTRWFLAGFGLEVFIAGFAQRETVKSSEIEIATSVSDAAYGDYMRRLSEWIHQRQNPTSALSPYECIDERFGATFLSSPKLEESAIDSYERWASGSEHFYSMLLGTVPLVVPEAGGQWMSAYRYLMPDSQGKPSLPGSPFVTIEAHRGASGSTLPAMSVVEFTDSTIWLLDSNAINGFTNNECAEANLRTLANVGELLVGTRLEPVELTLAVESQTFRADYGRIERAFSAVLAKKRA